MYLHNHPFKNTKNFFSFQSGLQCTNMQFLYHIYYSYRLYRYCTIKRAFVQHRYDFSERSSPDSYQPGACSDQFLPGNGLDSAARGHRYFPTGILGTQIKQRRPSDLVALLHPDIKMRFTEIAVFRQISGSVVKKIFRIGFQ